MDMDLRLDKYDFHYQFRMNPHAFDWNFHPERIIIRNEALRTRDEELYARYLQATSSSTADSSNRADQELKSFRKAQAHLRQLSGVEAAELLENESVAILRSDIHWQEADAIFTAKAIPELDISLLVGEEQDEQLILNYVYPAWLADRSLVWLDLSELPLKFL